MLLKISCGFPLVHRTMRSASMSRKPFGSPGSPTVMMTPVGTMIAVSPGTLVSVVALMPRFERGLIEKRRGGPPDSGRGEGGGTAGGTTLGGTGGGTGGGPPACGTEGGGTECGTGGGTDGGTGATLGGGGP